MEKFSAFVTGGTGYIGVPLIRALVERGHPVRALARTGSESKLPAGCEAVIGDALDANSHAGRVAPAHTFVQLVGVAHPSPSKAKEFQAIDRASGMGAIAAAKDAGIQHFVYLSVAHPAPIMKSYIEVRQECEATLRASGMNVTIVRPWYVLGPGHRWPYALLPMYWICERLAWTRESAARLGLVTLAQLTRALVRAVENPCIGARIVAVPQIREPDTIA